METLCLLPLAVEEAVGRRTDNFLMLRAGLQSGQLMDVIFNVFELADGTSPGR
jgi:hypothetical protein